MWSLALVILAGTTAPAIQRDAFGVPHIRASTWVMAFHDAGYAVAEDRMWQLENSRRLARLAEVFGPSFAASDREVLKGGYTDAEIQEQVNRLPGPVQDAYRAYA